MSSGELESWWERADWALGQAGQVLDRATERFLAGELDIEEASAAATLTQAWIDLSQTWNDREETDEEEEDEDDEADRQRWRAGRRGL